MPSQRRETAERRSDADGPVGAGGGSRIPSASQFEQERATALMRQRRSPQSTIRPGAAPGGKPQAGRPRPKNESTIRPGAAAKAKGRPAGRPPDPRGRSRPTIRPSVAPAAELAAAIVPKVVQAVIYKHQHLGPAMAEALEGRGEIRIAKDRAGITRSLRALFRWWGWIDPLRLHRAEEQLLLASLLDSPELRHLRPGLGRAGGPARRLVGARGRRPELDGPRGA